MDKLKEYKYIITLVLIILGIAFYWYEVRPARIRAACDRHVTEGGLALTTESERQELGRSMVKINKVEQEKGEYWYRNCLHEKGLE